MRQGAYAEALRALERSEQAFVAALGANHDKAHYPAIARARAFNAVGRRDEARTLIERTIAHFRRTQSSATLMACLSVLATIQRDSGRLNEARAAASEALQIQGQLSNAEHWREAAFEIELADVEARLGQHEVARSRAEHVHPILLRVLGAQHSRTQRAAELL